jgi:hypothetical protein
VTVGDANDINHALKYLLGISRVNFPATDSEFARLAACRLADRANKALMAGIGAADVNAAWPASRPRRKKGPRS